MRQCDRCAHDVYKRNYVLNFMRKKDGKRVVIKEKFRMSLLDGLENKFGSITNAAGFLDVNRQIFYHFKQRRINSLDKTLFLKIIEILGRGKEDMVKREYDYREEIDRILKLGAEIRRSNLKQLKADIPSVEEILDSTYLNLEKWFNFYVRLIDGVAREVKTMDIKNNKIRVSYFNYSNGKKKLFVNNLPRKIKIDKEFSYFFGLWCGDRVGKGRFGVANKDPEINKFTEKY